MRAIDYAVRSHLRGRHRLGPLGVQVQDPFGLANRNAVLEGTADLVVLPAVHPLSSNRQPSAGVGSEGEQAHLIALHGEDDVTIREYRDGDDLRRIHWPATARTGDLMVRQEDRPAQRRAVVLHRPPARRRTGARGASSSFEWAVTAAASVAVHLVRVGVCRPPRLRRDGRERARGRDHDPGRDPRRARGGEPARRHRRGRDPAAPPRRSLQPAGFLVAIVGPSGRELTSRVASLRQPGTTGLALVLDARGFGETQAEEAEPHVDSLRLAGWRAVAVERDEDVAHAWAVLTAATVGGSR